MADEMELHDHSDCADLVRRLALSLGTEVTVSVEPPIVAGPYTVDSFRCPHGTDYWVEPTGEQLAAWARDGVR